MSHDGKPAAVYGQSMTSPSAKLAWWAVIVAHLVLAGLLIAAIPGMQRCSGDFIGSCLTFLIPFLLGSAIFVLIGLARWAGGAVGTLVIADVTAVVLAVAAGAAPVAVMAVVAIVTLAAADIPRREP